MKLVKPESIGIYDAYADMTRIEQLLVGVSELLTKHEEGEPLEDEAIEAADLAVRCALRVAQKANSRSAEAVRAWATREKDKSVAPAPSR